MPELADELAAFAMDCGPGGSRCGCGAPLERNETRCIECVMQDQEDVMVEEAKKVHDGKPLPVELWGKDHRTTMLYIETRCVDYKGVPAAAHMRTGKGRPRRGDVSGRNGAVPAMDAEGPSYPTVLADGSELHEHDDWDCVDDFEAAGLLEWQGTGLNPIFELTEKGWAFAHQLRRQRAARTKEASLQEAFGAVA